MIRRHRLLELAIGTAWAVLAWGAGSLIAHPLMLQVATTWPAVSDGPGPELALRTALWALAVAVAAIMGPWTAAASGALGTAWLAWLFWPWTTAAGNPLAPLSFALVAGALAVSAIAASVLAERLRPASLVRREANAILLVTAILALFAGAIGWTYWAHHTGLAAYYEQRDEFSRAFLATGVPPEVTRASWRAMWAGIVMPQTTQAISGEQLRLGLRTHEEPSLLLEVSAEQYPVEGYRPPECPATETVLAYRAGHALVYYFLEDDRLVGIYLAPS